MHFYCTGIKQVYHKIKKYIKVLIVQCIPIIDKVFFIQDSLNFNVSSYTKLFYSSNNHVTIFVDFTTTFYIGLLLKSASLSEVNHSTKSNSRINTAFKIKEDNRVQDHTEGFPLIVFLVTNYEKSIDISRNFIIVLSFLLIFFINKHSIN